MKYQIVEYKKNENTAASKAVNDVVVIAEQIGFEKKSIIASSSSNNKIYKIIRQLSYAFQWIKVYREIPEGSIVLLQHPFRNRQLLRYRLLSELKKKRKVKYVCLVHDVEQLRGYMFNHHYEVEFSEMLSLANVLIVHNSIMQEFFLEQGVDSSRIINLQIFDYLVPNFTSNQTLFSRNVYVAGNLDPQKSGYIAKLPQVSGVQFVLYGVNLPGELASCENIDYRGVVQADQLPTKLVEGFGLVWDGNEIDSCSGGTGEYLKYNNPHKLSLYLTSGIPVIIWDQAAESTFVKEHNLGITISSISEISEKLACVTKEEYEKMSQNVKDISNRLVKGGYTTSALNEAVYRLENLRG